MSRASQLAVNTKPLDSLVDKSFRQNALFNENWPAPPDGGWILPDNWFETTRDVLRTSIVVKYLDGVTFLADKLAEVAQVLGLEAAIDYEAREEGYYAAHYYVSLAGEMPLPKWDTKRIIFVLEVQITTQMQEAIRVLTHHFYEERRSRLLNAAQKKWQWNYDSDEFRANYLAHTLHHIEGLIMDIRVRGGKSDGNS